MSLQRKAAKRDATEPAIIEALVKAGCQVAPLSDRGIPDLLVCLPVHMDSETVLVECKSKGGQLTPDQVAFFSIWRGRKYIAYSAQDALKQLGLGE